MSVSSNNTHVLLVGVDHYDNEPGANLRGCRNDVISWWRLCVGHLRVPPSQITILASPPLAIEELTSGGAYTGAEHTKQHAATKAHIVEQFTHLAAIVGKDKTASGLFVFAGHGLTAGPPNPTVPGTNLAICPQDVQVEHQDDLKIIHLTELETILGETREYPEWGPQVTMVLDACYHGRGRHFFSHKRGKHNAWKAAVSSERKEKQLGVQSRLIMASQEWADAYEMQIEGDWHGACSWMMTRLLERWNRRSNRQANNANYINVSYEDLLRHTANALGLFSQKRQIPVMWGLRLLDEAPFLYVGNEPPKPGSTSPEPDRQERGRQIPVSPTKVMVLQLEDYTGTIIQAVIAGTNDGTDASLTVNTVDIAAGQECWFYSTAAGLVDTGGPLTLSVLGTFDWSSPTLQTDIDNLMTLTSPGHFLVEEDGPLWKQGDYSNDSVASWFFFAVCEPVYGDPVGFGVAYDSSDVLQDIVLFAPQSYVSNADGAMLLQNNEREMVSGWSCSFQNIQNGPRWNLGGTDWEYYSYSENSS